jgi:ribosomal 50S subunit-recycling heat shock protein
MNLALAVGLRVGINKVITSSSSPVEINTAIVVAIKKLEYPLRVRQSHQQEDMCP